MPEDNYPSSSEVIRNLSQVSGRYSVIHEDGKFRVVRFEQPYWGGYEFWVVNRKGFLWEPADSLDGARAYLASPEAREYNEAD